MSTNTNRGRKMGGPSRKSDGIISKSMNYVSGMNRIVLMLVGIFIFFIVGLIVYWLYQAYQRSIRGDSNNPILVSAPIDASDPKNSKSWELPLSSGSNSPNSSFTISFWMYIANWYYRVDEPKAIFIKDKSINGFVDGNMAAPGIWLAPNKNNLIVATKVLGREKLQVCDVANIPIQKWVHIAYVLNNRTVDVYVDCKLERSCVLTGVPQLNNHKFYLFPKNRPSPGTTNPLTGFLGQLSSLRYFSSALKPNDILRICNKGPHITKNSPSKPPSNGGGGGGGDECPSNTLDYRELHLVKKQLKNASSEVDTILKERDRIERMHGESKRNAMTDEEKMLRKINSQVNQNFGKLNTIEKNRKYDPILQRLINQSQQNNQALLKLRGMDPDKATLDHISQQMQQTQSILRSLQTSTSNIQNQTQNQSMIGNLANKINENSKMLSQVLSVVKNESGRLNQIYQKEFCGNQDMIKIVEAQLQCFPNQPPKTISEFNFNIAKNADVTKSLQNYLDTNKVDTSKVGCGQCETDNKTCNTDPNYSGNIKFWNNVLVPKPDPCPGAFKFVIIKYMLNGVTRYLTQNWGEPINFRGGFIKGSGSPQQNKISIDDLNGRFFPNCEICQPDFNICQPGLFSNIPNSLPINRLVTKEDCKPLLSNFNDKKIKFVRDPKGQIFVQKI